MLYGICRGDRDLDTLLFIKKIGFDYVECNFGDLSKMSDNDYSEYKCNLHKSDIPCRASNCFLPGEYKVSSGEYDKTAVSHYIEKGMKRGAEIGMKTIAFGSGGARSIPEGMQYAKAFINLGDFLRETVSPLAEKYGITVVIEPLRLAECNIINTVKEGAMLSALAKSENVGVLADIYHMVCSGDSIDNITHIKGSLKHAHISYPFGDDEGMKRTYPKTGEEYDYKSFTDALREVGCASCSIEAGTEDLETDAVKAINVLKSL